jgi:hypothetical protein
MRLARYVLLLAAATAIAACGDSTAPAADVSGSWSLTISNLAGGGATCDFTAMTLTLTQTGSTFSGTHGTGTISCSGGGSSFTDPVGSGPIVNGTVGGSGSVAFDFETSDFHLSGTISGTSMSGTATLKVDAGAPVGVVTLTGNWGASRT